jgi:hypothetical protein
VAGEQGKGLVDEALGTKKANQGMFGRNKIKARN